MVGDQLLGKMDYHSAAFPGTRASGDGPTVADRRGDPGAGERPLGAGPHRAPRGLPGHHRATWSIFARSEERAVILYFRLPVDADGRAMGPEPGRGGADPAGAAVPQRRPTSTRRTAPRCPGCRSPRSPAHGWGLSMAQPMDVPRFFRIAYQAPYGLQMEYEFGLSPITWKFRNRAPFQFLLYRHDPTWGLRSAFERYYRFFPELFRKIVRDGMWIDDWEGKRAQLGDPADYGDRLQRDRQLGG